MRLPVPAVVVVWVAVALGLDTSASLTGQRLIGLLTWVTRHRRGRLA